MYVCMCVCVYVCVYACMHVCMYVLILENIKYAWCSTTLTQKLPFLNFHLVVP